MHDILSKAKDPMRQTTNERNHMPNTEKKSFLSNRLFQIILLAADAVLLVVIIISITSARSAQPRPDTQINITVTEQEKPSVTVTSEPAKETAVPQDTPAATPSGADTNSGSQWNEDWLKGGL